MWIFAYGSLMWDGWERSFGATRIDGAVLANHRRSFNKKSVSNWGTPSAPCPTLGLEPATGVDCIGTAFELPEEQRTAVERWLIRREGKSFALIGMSVRLPDGRDVCALTPVNDRTKSTYLGEVPLEERAKLARTARGRSGGCADYVRNIREKLSSLGIVDEDVEAFAALIE
jgi:glutathione-specific gamma-glutamylcyclotransferase